jgi:hypothetical protein
MLYWIACAGEVMLVQYGTIAALWLLGRIRTPPPITVQATRCRRTARGTRAQNLGVVYSSL